MQSLNLNLWVVLGAGAAKFMIGGLWYSVFFQKAWLKLMGLKKGSMKQGAGKAMGLEFLGNLLMAFVLAHAIRYAGAQGVMQGIGVGFANWLGFIATFGMGSVIFEKKPFKLFLINQSFQLISMLVMGVILVLWV